jgi:hypothetical protein
MKVKMFCSVLGTMALMAMFAPKVFAYNVEQYGKESSSTVYKVTCSDGSNNLVRNENNGKWCSGSTCYASLDALMRNAFSNCK